MKIKQLMKTVSSALFAIGMVFVSATAIAGPNPDESVQKQIASGVPFEGLILGDVKCGFSPTKYTGWPAPGNIPTLPVGEVGASEDGYYLLEIAYSKFENSNIEIPGPINYETINDFYTKESVKTLEAAFELDNDVAEKFCHLVSDARYVVANFSDYSKGEVAAAMSLLNTPLEVTVDFGYKVSVLDIGSNIKFVSTCKYQGQLLTKATVDLSSFVGEPFVVTFAKDYEVANSDFFYDKQYVEQMIKKNPKDADYYADKQQFDDCFAGAKSLANADPKAFMEAYGLKF